MPYDTTASLPAIDGGFLQVLMTASTGDTAIERAARPGCAGGKEIIPEELERLRVRFGELIASDQVPSDEPESPSLVSEIESRQSRDSHREASISEAASASLLEARESDEIEEEEEEEYQPCVSKGRLWYYRRDHSISQRSWSESDLSKAHQVLFHSVKQTISRLWDKL